MHFLHSTFKILEHLLLSFLKKNDSTFFIFNSFSDRLPIPFSFIWSCMCLPCSFICNIFIVVSFLDEWDCVPVLLVVLTEVSSSGVCSKLGRARSWYWDVDLWVTSLQSVFLGACDFLLLQQFRLSALTSGLQAWSLAHEQWSCKPWAVGQKKAKRKEGREIRNKKNEREKSRTITKNKS